MKNKKQILPIGIFIIIILIGIFLSINQKIIPQKTENTIKISLTKENNYTDGAFSREATSGSGTGVFIGEKFEFAQENCNNLSLDTKWKNEVLGCSSKILNKEWCARNISNPSENYTLYFISWTIGPQEKCIGECKENNNKTTYLKTKN